MTTELQLQEGLQTCLRTLSAFASADVVINDWTILDGSSANAPFLIIENADEFDDRQQVKTPGTIWQEQVTLLERWTMWTDTLNNFRLHRQAILDAFDDASTNFRTAGGLSGVMINRIRSANAPGPVYHPDVDPALRPDMMPLFWGQTFIFECTLF